MVVRAKIVVLSALFRNENKLLSFTEFMNFLVSSLASFLHSKLGQR
jgi:hypothetical protein